jgi:hypothetical protein
MAPLAFVRGSGYAYLKLGRRQDIGIDEWYSEAQDTLGLPVGVPSVLEVGD